MTRDLYFNTPFGSLAVVTDGASDAEYVRTIHHLPPLLLTLITSEKTGAYVLGLARTYNIVPADIPTIAFAVLRVATGKLALAQLGGVLSTELKIANDVAQKMAAELEHDLFAPVAGELSAYLEAKKLEARRTDNKATGNPRAAGASNVLDLKNKPRPPVPPPLPRR